MLAAAAAAAGLVIVLAAAGPVPLAYATGSQTGTVLRVVDQAAGADADQVLVLTGLMTGEGPGADR